MNEWTTRARAGKWANSASPYCDVAVLEQFDSTIRSTDVFLSTFPKCGTTLVQNLLYQLREGGDPNLDCIYNHVPWLEYPVDGVSAEERLKHYAERKDPRIFKLHLRFDECPYFYFVTPAMGLIELRFVSDRRIHARSVVVGVVLR